MTAESPVPLVPESPPRNDTSHRRMVPLTDSGAWFVCKACGCVVAAPDQHNDWHDEMEMGLL